MDSIGQIKDFLDGLDGPLSKLQFQWKLDGRRNEIKISFRNQKGELITVDIFRAGSNWFVSTFHYEDPGQRMENSKSELKSQTIDFIGGYVFRKTGIDEVLSLTERFVQNAPKTERSGGAGRASQPSSALADLEKDFESIKSIVDEALAKIQRSRAP